MGVTAAITLWMVWLLAFFAGGLTMLGLAAILTGRLVFGFGLNDWSAREARQLGALHTTWGLTFGLYALYGGLTLVARLFPPFFVGHWWGMLISFVPAVVLLSGLFLQMLIVDRHRRLGPPRSAGR